MRLLARVTDEQHGIFERLLDQYCTMLKAFPAARASCTAIDAATVADFSTPYDGDGSSVETTFRNGNGEHLSVLCADTGRSAIRCELRTLVPQRVERPDPGLLATIGGGLLCIGSLGILCAAGCNDGGEFVNVPFDTGAKTDVASDIEGPEDTADTAGDAADATADTDGETFVDIVEDTPDVVTDAGDTVEDVVEDVADVTEEVTEDVGEILDTLGDIVDDIVDAVVPDTDDAEDTADIAEDAVEDVADAVEDVTEDIADVAGDVGDALEEILDDAGDAAGDLIDVLVPDTVADAIADALDTAETTSDAGDTVDGGQDAGDTGDVGAEVVTPIAIDEVPPLPIAVIETGPTQPTYTYPDGALPFQLSKKTFTDPDFQIFGYTPACLYPTAVLIKYDETTGEGLLVDDAGLPGVLADPLNGPIAFVTGALLPDGIDVPLHPAFIGSPVVFYPEEISLYTGEPVWNPVVEKASGPQIDTNTLLLLKPAAQGIAATIDLCHSPISGAQICWRLPKELVEDPSLPQELNDLGLATCPGPTEVLP